jgi:hypothetical protein
VTKRFLPVVSSRLVRYAVIGVVIIIAIFIGLKIFRHVQAQSVTETEVVAVVRANFPDFCTDGQIMAKPIIHDRPIILTDFDVQWSIKCDSWMKNPMGFDGDATIIDVDQCTTIRPIIGTVGIYYFPFEAINKTHRRKKLAPCP